MKIGIIGIGNICGIVASPRQAARASALDSKSTRENSDETATTVSGTDPQYR
jgi:hypothetical protein